MAPSTVWDLIERQHTVPQRLCQQMALKRCGMNLERSPQPSAHVSAASGT
jgi:hypothetical protein